MLTAFELNAIERTANALEKVSESIALLNNTLASEKLPKVPICPDRPMPKECKDFDEWASDLSFDDRRRLMIFLWQHPYWHNTCVREEDV